MTENVTRADMIEQGLLIPYDDMSEKAGLIWPAAVSLELDGCIFQALPPFPDTDKVTEDVKLAILDHVMSVVVFGLFVQVSNELVELAQKEENMSRTTFDIKFVPLEGAQPIDVTIQFVDDDGKPAIDLRLKDEIEE